jgi:hypothetical protein
MAASTGFKGQHEQVPAAVVNSVHALPRCRCLTFPLLLAQLGVILLACRLAGRRSRTFPVNHQVVQGDVGGHHSGPVAAQVASTRRGLRRCFPTNQSRFLSALAQVGPSSLFMFLVGLELDLLSLKERACSRSLTESCRRYVRRTDVCFRVLLTDLALSALAPQGYPFAPFALF